MDYELMKCVHGEDLADFLKAHPDTRYYGEQWKSLIGFKNKILCVGKNLVAGTIPLIARRQDGSYAPTIVKGGNKYGKYICGTFTA